MATVWKGSRPSSMKACDTANTLEMVKNEETMRTYHLVVIFFPGPFQLLSKPTTLLKSKATRQPLNLVMMTMMVRIGKATRQLLNLAVRMIPDPGFHAPIF